MMMMNGGKLLCSRESVKNGSPWELGRNPRGSGTVWTPRMRTRTTASAGREPPNYKVVLARKDVKPRLAPARRLDHGVLQSANVTDMPVLTGKFLELMSAPQWKLTKRTRTSTIQISFWTPLTMS